MADSLRALVPPGLATRPGPRMDQMPQGSRAPLAGTRVNNHQLFFQPSRWAWSHSGTWESGASGLCQLGRVEIRLIHLNPGVSGDRYCVTFQGALSFSRL